MLLLLLGANHDIVNSLFRSDGESENVSAASDEAFSPIKLRHRHRTWTHEVTDGSLFKTHLLMLIYNHDFCLIATIIYTFVMFYMLIFEFLLFSQMSPAN